MSITKNVKICDKYRKLPYVKTLNKITSAQKIIKIYLKAITGKSILDGRKFVIVRLFITERLD